MKHVLCKVWRLPRLIPAMAGLSLLLASCASTNEKTANIGSAFPVTYNAGAREFDSHWPYGPEGYH
jgi:hypothetical protein